MNQNKLTIMEKIKKAYYYFFYKIYKSIEYTSELVGGAFWTDFKAGLVILTFELWIIGSFLNYYSIINDQKLDIYVISPILLIFLTIFSIINYFAFMHNDIWKKYNENFEKLPKKENQKGTTIVMVVWIFIFYYFSFGNLKIIIKNDNELFFEWEKKFIFNYKSIDPVKIRDIKTIVLDNGSSLKKIKTIDHTIYINNSNINSNDMVKFIEKIKEDNIRIIDSWDEFKEKGYLKTAYLINTIVLIITFIVFIIFTILRGFNLLYLSIFLLFIPQIILYQKHIKSKIQK